MSRAYKRSPETRARMSAARKAALADPEVRARMSAASKAALADPEVRARMSAARKAAWARKRPELADFSDDELSVYRTLRRKQCTHSEAVAEVFRVRRKVA